MEEGGRDGMDPDHARSCCDKLVGKVGSTGFSRINSGRAAQPRIPDFIAAFPVPGAAVEPFPLQKCPCTALPVN